MDNYLADLIWENIKMVVLFVVLLVMIVLFKRQPSESQKALWVGAGLFILTIFFNVVGFIEISDYLSILGFVVIVFALVRLFWSESNKME